MNVKLTLWDAVEHNEQIELLLTRLEERFKELKQKGYLMNISVQEKLKEIDNQITTLLEEQSKLNNQEDEEMKDSYLEGYFKAFSKEVDKEYQSFENTVNKMLHKREKENPTREEHKYRNRILIIFKIQRLDGESHFVGRCDEALFVESCNDKSMLIDYFESFIDKKEIKKIKDEDVELVEQFHLALKTVFKDMNTVPLVTHPKREQIQTVKLNKIYELYRDSLRLSTYESFVKYYFSHYKYLNQ